MRRFTGYEYIQIDVANNFGMDKEDYDVRLNWVQTHMDELEDLMEEAPYKTRILYIKAVRALRDAQNKVPTGHLVGFDACSSGAQIMSAVTGCAIGCRNTGLINTGHREDFYTNITKNMGHKLGADMHYDRGDVKKGGMTHFYGSKMEPKSVFGEGTEELDTFYQSVEEEAPGASYLMRELLSSWQPDALSHDWVMPDNFHVHCKNMVEVTKEIKVDELGGAQFTHIYKENQGEKARPSIAAK